MSTLSPVPDETRFIDLEPLVCDAANAADAMMAIVDDLFAEKAQNGDYVLSDQEGSRLHFLAGLASAMATKMREAYYVAYQNQHKKVAP